MIYTTKVTKIEVNSGSFFIPIELIHIKDIKRLFVNHKNEAQLSIKGGNKAFKRLSHKVSYIILSTEDKILKMDLSSIIM